MSNTKEHILDVSFSLFLQKNFKEVTMQEIIEKTGMSKGAFYHYFESKEQLLWEIINHFSSALIADFSKLNKDSLYQFYHDYIKFLNDRIYSLLQHRKGEENDFDLNYYILIFDAMRLFPDFQKKMVEALEVEQKAWEEIVHLARDKGEIRSSMTDQQIANMFIYTSEGVGMHNTMKDTIENITNSLVVMWDPLYKSLKV
ncbi:MAG TPA: TetR/AcrR family transcriptional regulator [Firmicutes bacterium]|jgi:TetR/AcrR family transcriptional regulator, transcriptional repressor for nem operon|nr:TetR/AcrR family transcriptional regulator [Bacillota bacterium]